jgi:tetratricopeptide (TPR) repeat protein
VARNKQTTSAFEILFFENVLKEAPDFIEALIALGDLYTKEGYYQKGLEVDERLARLRPDDGVVLYNLACSYSLINDVPRAREAMKAAFKNGYEDIEHLVKDTDLLNLLADTQFVDILKDRRKPRTRKSKMTTKEGA